MRLLPVNEKKGVLLLALANVVAALSLSGVLQALVRASRLCVMRPEARSRGLTLNAHVGRRFFSPNQ